MTDEDIANALAKWINDIAPKNLDVSDVYSAHVLLCHYIQTEPALRATISEQAATIARLEGERAAQQRTLFDVYRVLTADAEGTGATYLQAAEWLRNRAEQAEAERDALRATIAEQAATIARLEGERVEALHMHQTVDRAWEEALAERDALRARVAKLREWMAEYPNDKYTGTWWLAEFDRICKEHP